MGLSSILGAGVKDNDERGDDIGGCFVIIQEIQLKGENMIRKNIDLWAWLALVVLFLAFPDMSIGKNKPWSSGDVENPYAIFIKGAFLIFVLVVILYRRWRNK